MSAAPPPANDLRPYEEVVASFLRKLKVLANDMRRRFPDDAHVLRAHKRIMLAADTLPVDVIQITGRRLMQYQEVIDSNDPSVWAQFFDEGSEDVFTGEVQAVKGADTRSLATHIVPRLQGLARQESHEVRYGYILQARGLIDDYLEFAEHMAS